MTFPFLELARTYGARGFVRRAVHEALLRGRVYPLLDAASVGPAPPPRFLTVDRTSARQVLARDAGAASTAVDTARAILAGHYPFFSGATRDIGWPPRWHEHPITGAVWPTDRHWSAYAHSPQAHGDIKWIWEPARFAFAWLFPRAWLVSGERRFADETWRGIRDWLDHDPPAKGPDWYCAQELSFRCFAVLFAASVFDAEGLLPDGERQRIADFLHVAAHRIARTLGHAMSQRNNHALSEVIGLWTLSHVLREAPAADAWRRRSEDALRECLCDQFASDGAYIQESLNYHRLALHVLLWARFVARSFQVELPAEVTDVLRRSFDLLRGLVPVEGGELPNYGHNDGALLLALSSCGYRDARPTLQHVARELGEALPFAEGPWDEPAAWLGLGAKPRAVASPPAEGLRITSSGYVSSHRGRWMVSSRVPVYTHHRPAHADALHVDLWRGERNVALDPGSFAYSEPPPWDNALAETRVHNTCSVGDRSQMRRRGRFLWTEWSRAVLLAQGEHEGASIWLARVTCAWGTGFVHTRLVRHGPEQVDILDRVEGDEDDRVRLHWNLEGTGWRRDGQRWEHGDVMVVIDGSPSTVRDISGDPGSPLGWTSPTYGVKVPCTAIELELAASRAWFHTVFASSDKSIAPLPDAVLARWRAGDLTATARLLIEGR